MPINVGSAFISLRARTRDFVRGVNSSARVIRRQERAFQDLRRRIRATNRTFTNFRRNLFSLRGAIGAVLGGGALSALIRSQTEFGAQLVENSRQVGFSVETLQLLGRAFQGEGGQLDRFNKSLVNFSRVIADADRGLATYRDQFDILGVSLRDSSGRLRDSESILFDVADGFQNLSSAAQRVSAAYNLFGGRNIAFLNILQQGSGALRENLQQFRALGIVTTEEAINLKILDQSFTDLGTTLRVASASGVAQAADSLHLLNQRLLEIGPGAIASFIGTIRLVIENLHVLREIATALGLFLGVRWVRQIFLAVQALRGLTIAAAASKIGLAALAGPAGILAATALAFGYFAVRARSAGENLSAFASQLQQVVEESSEGRLTGNLVASIRQLEERIDDIRTRVAQNPLVLRTQLDERELPELESQLREFRSRLRAIVDRERLPTGAVDAPNLAPTPRDPTAGLLPSARQAQDRARQQLALIGRTRDEARRLQAEFEASLQLATSGATTLDPALWRLLADTIEETAAITDRYNEAQSRLAQNDTFRQFAEDSARALETRQAAFRETVSAIREGREAEVSRLQNAEDFYERIADLQEQQVGAGESRRAQLQDQIRQLMELQTGWEQILVQEQQINAIREARQLLEENSLEGIRARYEAQTIALERANSLAQATEDERQSFELQRDLVARIVTLRRAAVDAARQGAFEEAEALRKLAEQLGLEQAITDIQRGRREAARSQQRQAEQVIETARERQRIEQEISNTLSRGLGEAILHARSLQDVFKGILASVVQIIARAAINRFLAPIIGAALGAPAAGRQHGGPVGAGRAYLVGERGPELFVPRTPGGIVPNNLLNRMSPGGSGITVINEFNIESTDGPGVTAALQRILPSFQRETVEAAKQVINRDQRRPSSLSS